MPIGDPLLPPPPPKKNVGDGLLPPPPKKKIQEVGGNALQNGVQNGSNRIGGNNQAVIDWVNKTYSKKQVQPVIKKEDVLTTSNNLPITKKQAQDRALQKIQDGKSNLNPFSQDPLGELRKSETKTDEQLFKEGRLFNNQSEKNRQKVVNEEIGLAKNAIADNGYDAREVLKDSRFLYADQNNETANYLREKVDTYKKTTDPLNNLVGDKRYDFKNAAIKAFANNNKVFADDLKSAGIDVNDVELAEKIPDAKVGQILEWYTTNPDTRAYAEKENPEIIPILNDVQQNIFKEHPEYAINQVANKVSQARLEKHGNAPFADWTESKADYEDTNKIAEQVLTPDELRVYNQTIRDNQDEYLDKPSFLASVGGSIKGLFGSVGKLASQPFTSNKELIWNKLERDASTVSANPKGFLKFLTDTGHVTGFLMGVGATGNVSGLSELNALTLATTGDIIENAREEYPNNPVKAGLSALLQAAMYRAVGKEVFPVSKTGAFFKEVSPRINAIVDNLSAGKITQEMAKRQSQSIIKDVLNFAGGALKKDLKISTELTALQGIDRVFDRVNMDDETFKQYHPDDELIQAFEHNFLSNAVIAGIGKAGEMKGARKMTEEAVYQAALNPKQTERLLNDASINLSFGEVNDRKENLKFVSDLQKELESKGVKPEEQKKQIFEALSKKVTEQPKETTPESEPTSTPEPTQEQLKPTEDVQEEKVQDIQTEKEKKTKEIITKVDNAEYINEKDISEAEDHLYEQLDNNPEAAHLIEPLILKLQNYEFTTKTETRQVTEKVPTGRTAKIKREVKPALEQSTGSRVTVTNPNGTTSTGVLKIENGNYYVIDGKGNKVSVLGEKVLNDKYLKLPEGEESPVELDSDGNVKSVTLQTKDGKLIKIENPEKALDIAIQLQAQAVGEIPDGAFNEIYDEVVKTIPVEVLKSTGQEIGKTEPSKKTITEDQIKTNETAIIPENNTSNKQSNKPTEEGIGTSEAPPEPPKETEPPSPPPQTSKEVIDRGSDLPERQFSKRMLRDEDLTEDTKKGVYKNLNYIRHTDQMAVDEANRLIKETGIDEVQNLVMNDNDIKPKVRVTLGQILIRKYNELAKNADNEPERLHYLDKTIQTANYVTEKLGTEAGQTIQAFTMWSQLSPEGQLRAANQDVERVAKEKMRRREKDVKVISDKFKKANEEAVDEITKDKNIEEGIKKDNNEKISKAQEKIKKAREKRQDIIKKYKGGKGKNLFSSPLGLTPEGIEFVGDIAKTYIQEGIANVEILVQKILIHLEDAAGKKPTDEIIKQVNDISEKQFDKADKSFLGKALKDKNIQIGKIIKEHYTVIGKAKRNLSQKFMDEAGMEQSNAKELAAKVESAFDRIATRKKRNILYNEKARFDKIQKSFQSDKKAEPKTIQSEIIKYSNLGAFENADMMNMLADKFGLKKLTPEQAGELMKLAEKVQKAPEGSPKNDATEDLLAYRAKLLGNNIGEAAQSAWYANVLSGYRTHEKNIVSTFLNSWAELGAEMVKDPKAIPYLIGGYIKGISKRGLVEAKHTFTTGRSPIHIKKIETPNALERVKFKGGGWNPANWFKYVTRLMVAEDVLSFQGLKEARAYQLARREASRQGKNTWTKEGWNKVNDVLFHTRERMLIAEDQAQTEGLKKGTTEFRRRVYELMENSRPEQMTEDAYNFAANGTFNYNSTGTLGAITNAVSKALDAVNVKGVKPLRLVVPFTRIITNVVNNSLDFTPIGLVRAARGVRGFRGFEESQITKGSFKELSREERQRLVAKAATGIVFAATFQALHAAGVVTLTGGGNDDKKKLQQMKEQGWQPYSIKIGDKWYSYQYTPLVFMLGFLGNMNDQAEYGNIDERTLLKQMESASLRMGNQVVDMTWINSAGTFLGALADGSPNEQGKNVENALAGMVRGAIPFSQAITQTTGLYESIFNGNEKQVNNSWQALIKDIPIARNILNDKINALGQPVKKDVDVFISNEKKDPVWDLLSEKKGWVATISRNSAFKFNAATGKDMPLTDDEFYDFSKLRGEKIYNDISKMMQNGFPVIKNGKVINVSKEDITENEFNDVVSKIETNATTEAKSELFDKKIIDKKRQKTRQNWNEKIKSIILKK